jgi:hypothetical protein
LNIYQRKACLKRYVFRHDLKADSKSTVLSWSGMLFHKVDAVLSKRRLPITLWHSYPLSSLVPSLNSTASFLPQTLYRPISALTPPSFPFLFLPSAINCIQDYYYLILSLLYIYIIFQHMLQIVIPKVFCTSYLEPKI